MVRLVKLLRPSPLLCFAVAISGLASGCAIGPLGREGQRAPTRDTLRQLARQAPAGKAVYWLGERFDGARITRANYAYLWNDFDPERERGASIRYEHHQDSETWVVVVSTFPGHAVSDHKPGFDETVVPMKSGQQVLLQVAATPAIPDLVAHVRSALLPIPIDVEYDDG